MASSKIVLALDSGALIQASKVATAIAHGVTDIVTSDPIDIAALNGGLLNIVGI